MRKKGIFPRMSPPLPFLRFSLGLSLFASTGCTARRRSPSRPARWAWARGGGGGAGRGVGGGGGRGGAGSGGRGGARGRWDCIAEIWTAGRGGITAQPHGAVTGSGIRESAGRRGSQRARQRLGRGLA